MKILCFDSALSPEIDGGAGWTGRTVRLDFGQLHYSSLLPKIIWPKSSACEVAGSTTGVSISASFLWLLSLDEQRK